MANTALPKQAVTLSVEQIAELNHKLSSMRHAINNQLSVVVAAAELIRLKPQILEERLTAMRHSLDKLTQAVNEFSAEFERTFGITRL